MLKKIILASSFMTSLLCSRAQARDATVFDVRRPIAMENAEVPPKDYYINAGTKDGLKKGMVVTVTRRMNLYDQYQNKSLSDLVVTIGVLKVIHIQEDVAVARLEEIKGRDTLPTVEFDAIMVGDRIAY